MSQARLASSSPAASVPPAPVQPHSISPTDLPATSYAAAAVKIALVARIHPVFLSSPFRPQPRQYLIFNMAQAWLASSRPAMSVPPTLRSTNPSPPSYAAAAVKIACVARIDPVFISSCVYIPSSVTRTNRYGAGAASIFIVSGGAV